MNIIAPKIHVDLYFIDKSIDRSALQQAEMI